MAEIIEVVKTENVESATPTPDEVSRDSQISESTQEKRPPKVVIRRCPLDEIKQLITAETIFEYRWPPYSLDKFMIQEQIADYLDVKSFKRKYPDLTRRTVDGEEKEFLRQQGVVSNTLCNMGITALRYQEVIDFMAQDYPDKLTEYQKAVAERTKQEMAAKQMEYQAIKADSRRLEELRKKAMQCASEWNAEMNKERKNERACFFEEQTMLIHYPMKKSKTEGTNFGPYPVALIPGQFQNYYKRYTEAELNTLPINTVMDSEPHLPQRPCYSPEPILVSESDLLPKHEEKPTKAKVERRGSKSNLVHSERNSVEEPKEFNEHCAFCCEDLKPIDRYVQCYKCGSCGHPTCMEMSDEMYAVIKTYNWMCMECKPCSICSKLDEEDKMMFCDRCDRGYHTFCVGLNDLPSGRWICPKFCRKSSGGGSETPGKNSDQGSRSSTPLETPNKCVECGEMLMKSARRNRQRQRNLCENCSASKKK